MTATFASPRIEASRSMLRNVARGGAANLVGTAFTGVAGLGVTWLVARALEPAAAGAFFSATATFVLGVAVAKLGSQTSMVYWPARLRATGDGEGLARCLRVGLVPVVLAALVVGAGLWLGAARIPGVGAEPAYVAQVRALAVFLPAAALTDAVLATTRGFRVMRPTVLLDRIMRPMAQLILLAVLWLTGTAPAVFAAMWAAPYLPAALLAGYALARVARPQTTEAETSADLLPPRPRASGASTHPDFLPGDFWRFAAPRAVASMAQMALQRVDVLLVAALAGLAPAAMYAVAGRFVILGQFVNQGLSQSVQPRLAERLAIDDRVAANTLYRQATAWLVLATWPMYFLVVTYAAVYLGLFGHQYQQGRMIVVVLAGAMLVATACGMVDMVLAMGGRTWQNLFNVALALVAMLGVDALLVPRHGALGAAIGLAAAVLANNLVPLAQVRHGLGLHPFGRATLAAMALSSVCFAVPPLLLHFTKPGLALSIAVSVIGLAGYLFAIFGVSSLRSMFMQGGR
jgi:O-antigen/teichoic acid export membrane protein